MKTEKIRIKVSENVTNNTSYIVVQNGNVQHMSKGLTPLALSNISPNAAELMFKLEDCNSKEEALIICKSLVYGLYKLELM